MSFDGTTSIYPSQQYVAPRSTGAGAVKGTSTEGSSPAELVEKSGVPTAESEARTTYGGVTGYLNLQGFTARFASLSGIQQENPEQEAKLVRVETETGSQIFGDFVRVSRQYELTNEERDAYLAEREQRLDRAKETAQRELSRLLGDTGLPRDAEVDISYDSFEDGTFDVSSSDLDDQQRKRLLTALNSDRGAAVQDAFRNLKQEVNAVRQEKATQASLNELEAVDPTWSTVERQLAYFAYDQRAQEYYHGATTEGEIDRSDLNFSFSIKNGTVSSHFTDQDGVQRDALDFKEGEDIPAGGPAYKPWFYFHDQSLVQKWSPISIAKAAE